MGTPESTTWSVLANWGSEGWDAGAWSYIHFTLARTRDGEGDGELFGYGTWVEGDTATCWFHADLAAGP
jgi:hypothetical protein